jgi:hypothetical protein
MNAVVIISAVTSAIEIAKQFIEVGKDVAPIITSIYNLLAKKQHATQADVDLLQAQNDAWSAELQKELPPEED